uniref:SH2 domain-containing protein n=1 Tax=Panagrolaimus sp. ES5 TaxID=591445 RepID=A0AC34GFF3_9BILA
MATETGSTEKTNNVMFSGSNEHEQLPLLSCIQEPSVTLSTNRKIISPLGPDIRTRQWYHGFMTRREAEILCRKHGQWLVRVTHAGNNQDSEKVCFDD